MKKQILNNEFIRMQKLAGLITESQYKARLNEETESSSPKLLAFVDSSDLQTLDAYKELGFKVRSANGQYLAELDFKGYDWAAVLAMLEDCEDMGIKPSMMWNNKKYDFVKAMELADEKAAGDSYGDTGVGTKLNENTMDVMAVLNRNGIDEDYFESIGGKEVESGTEEWLDVLSDITGKDAYEGEFTPEDDKLIQKFISDMEDLGIELI